MGLTFPFSFSTSDMAPVHLNIHSTFNIYHRTVTLPHSSNSMFKFGSTRVLSKKSTRHSLTSFLKTPDLKSLQCRYSWDWPLSRHQFLRLRIRYFLLYGVHKTPSDTGDKEAARLHFNTIKYNIGKISLTVWSLFQCQCYRYNTNVPVRRRNSNGMPRSKPGSGNKKGGLE